MLKEIFNVITTEQSKELVEIAEIDLVNMTTLGHQIDGYRTAQGTWISNNLEISNYIKSIISEHTNLPIENMEDLHIVKYEVDGEYKEHHDFFFPNEEYYESACTNRGGQRLKSALIYLNDNFEGGETHFPKLNKIVKFCAADSVLNQKEVRYVNAIIEGPYISQIAHKNSGKLFAKRPNRKPDRGRHEQKEVRVVI